MLKIGDKVKVNLSEKDYDFERWNDFESNVTKILDMGWDEPQYELEDCPNLAWKAKNILLREKCDLK
jgi:hypothetical protein